MILQNFNQVSGVTWSFLMTNFGGKPNPTKVDLKSSYRILIISFLMSSVVVWIFYRAFIIAALSINHKKYPFHDLETLAKSNYL